MTMLSLVQLSYNDFMAQDTTLRKPCEAVVDFGSEFQVVVDDLLETFLSHKIAVGLAAPQVGVALRLAVININKEKGGTSLVVVNPEIVRRSERTESKRESCMSLPGYGGNVERNYSIDIKFQDRRGEFQSLAAKSFLARVLQHEVDHLDGILYIDRIDGHCDSLIEVDIFDND